MKRSSAASVDHPNCRRQSISWSQLAWGCVPPAGLLPGTRLCRNKRQAGLRSTLGDNLTQSCAGSAEDETGSFRGRRRVNYQSISLFSMCLI